MSLFQTKKPGLKRSNSIIVNEEGHNNLKEGYTRLKDNILYFNIDGNKNVIQVASSISGEGKTTTMANLSVSLHQSGKKVIVIDLDFRKPRLHRSFKVENVDGLGDYMLDKINKETLIKHSEYGVDIINRGEEITDSSMVLTSDKLKNLISELKKEYDYVLLDTPPVLIISDYIHISRLSDGILFNVAYGKTKKNQVKAAIADLKKNNIKIIGIAFTFYNPKKDTSIGYYNNYGYYNYGDK